MGINFELVKELLENEFYLGSTTNKRKKVENKLVTYKGGVARKRSNEKASSDNDDVFEHFVLIDNNNFLNKSFEANKLDNNVKLGRAFFNYGVDKKAKDLAIIDKELVKIPVQYVVKSKLGKNIIKIAGKTILKRKGIDTGQFTDSLGVSPVK